MVEVLTTFSLSGSLLKNLKNAVSIPYANITLNKTKYENIIETTPYSEGLDNTASLVYSGTRRKLSILGKTVAKP